MDEIIFVLNITFFCFACGTCIAKNENKWSDFCAHVCDYKPEVMDRIGERKSAKYDEREKMCNISRKLSDSHTVGQIQPV